MASTWAKEEMQGVDLKDRRLNERLCEVLSQLGDHPTASIPSACGGYAEMTAAYRLLDNDKVDFDGVLHPHIAATRRRIAAEPIVILAQDTTEIDLTRPEQQVVGAGSLDGSPRRGLFLHPLHAFTPDGTPLGTLAAKIMIRPDVPLPPAAQRAAKRKQTPIEEKESQRWVDIMRQVREEASLSPGTHFVAVADSEADIYELLVEAQASPGAFDWIVRACQDRAVIQGPVAGATLSGQVQAQEVLFAQKIHVRGRKAKVQCEDRGRRQPRQSRTAEVQVRAATVTVRPPERPDRRLPPVTVNAVLARETDPPAGETAVEWLLLTSMPIQTPEQVHEVLQTYCVRWMIEILFRTLKSGCRVEARRFERMERMLPCLAVYLIVAWRSLYVCRVAREMPDMSCEVIFEPAEWKSLYRVVRRQPHPPSPPPLAEVVRMVAELGGYVNRKRTDAPGPQTVWLGLQRLHDIALCWNLFGPEAKQESGDV